MDEIQDQCWYDSHFFLQESDLPEDIMIPWYLLIILLIMKKKKKEAKVKKTI